MLSCVPINVHALVLHAHASLFETFAKIDMVHACKVLHGLGCEGQRVAAHRHTGTAGKALRGIRRDGQQGAAHGYIESPRKALHVPRLDQGFSNNFLGSDSSNTKLLLCHAG